MPIYDRSLFRSYVTPNQHEKNEWSRMATAAYRIGRNDVGTMYSVAASASNGQRFRLDYFDQLMTGYRAWLMFGQWPVAARNTGYNDR